MKHNIITVEQKFNTITLFAGCGGSDKGLEMSRYFNPSLLAIEMDKTAGSNYERNFPDSPVWFKEIDESLTGDCILAKINECHPKLSIKIGELDLVLASPPCQGVSTCGKRNINDPRNTLYRKTIQLIQDTKAKVCLIENVKGLISRKMRPLYNRNVEFLEESGYKTNTYCLNSALYGVPQKRERVFVIGVRRDIAELGFLPTYPEITNETNEGLLICDLYPNIKAFTPGQYKRGWFTSYQICPTITATQSIRVQDGNSIRRMTIDEVKRFCSFPEDFILEGSYLRSHRCLGNCVPPLLMKALTKMVAENILIPYYDFLWATNKKAA